MKYVIYEKHRRQFYEGTYDGTVYYEEFEEAFRFNELKYAQDVVKTINNNLRSEAVILAVV
jgi:hypothetical protein